MSISHPPRLLGESTYEWFTYTCLYIVDGNGNINGALGHLQFESDSVSDCALFCWIIIQTKTHTDSFMLCATIRNGVLYRKWTNQKQQTKHLIYQRDQLLWMCIYETNDMKSLLFCLQCLCLKASSSISMVSAVSHSRAHLSENVFC